MFLTPEELATLTGIKTGRAGKTREERQADALRTMAIPFWVNAIGRPVVVRAVIEGRGQATQPDADWQPAIMRNAA